jgi:hypothetical protein
MCTITNDDFQFGWIHAVLLKAVYKKRQAFGITAEPGFVRQN